jgi:hypothetical protein
MFSSLAIRAALAAPCLASLFDEQPNDSRRTNAVDPPDTRHSLHTEAYNGDHEQPPACDGFHCVSPQRSAAKLLGKSDFSASEIPHDRNCHERGSEIEPIPEEQIA